MVRKTGIVLLCGSIPFSARMDRPPSELFSLDTGKFRLRTFFWSPSEPKAVIALVHGLGEHAGRYEHLGQYFSSRGVAVVAMDHRGHGTTPGTKGHCGTMNSFYKTIDALLDLVQTRFPNIPVFLYGHSMGGNVTLNYALTQSPAVNGVIATGAWIRLKEEPSKLLVLAAKTLSRLFPTLTQATGLDPAKISRDPEVVKAYVNDPLVHDRISLRTGYALIQGANHLKEFTGAPDFPVLIMHGSADQITLAAGSKNLAEQMEGQVFYKEWDGCLHEIHNEPEKEQVFDYILAWVGKVSDWL